MWTCVSQMKHICGERCLLNHHFVFYFCFVFSFYFIVLTFTYTCIHCLLHLLHPLLPSRFCPLLQLCWRENISDNKKDISFLLIWDKDSYTERIIVLLPCACVLQPTLVHFYQTSLLLPGPLPTVPLCQFKITLFTPQQGAHKPHSSFRFPFLSLFLPCTFSP
jgi:hypothetical protein